MKNKKESDNEKDSKHFVRSGRYNGKNKGNER